MGSEQEDAIRVEWDQDRVTCVGVGLNAGSEVRSS